MKELQPLVENPAPRQAQHIRPEELEKTARSARQRAIEIRHQGAVVTSMRSSYNLGGWKDLFEDDMQQPSSSSPSFPKLETSDRTANSADQSLSQNNHDSSSSESIPSESVPAATGTPLCPSGRPEAANAVVFGVVEGTVEAPQVAYLTEPVPVNEEIRALSDSVEPTEMFRIASTCASKGCQHFDGSNCRLAMRVVEQLPSTVETLPECQIRPHCRWWQQEGKAACLRCPQVVTDNYNPSDLAQKVATGSSDTTW